MKLIYLIAIVPSIAFAWTDVATVIDVEPNYRVMKVPYQHCVMEKVPVRVSYYAPDDFSSNRAPQNNSDALMGAIVGGALGSTIGKGDGRKAATAIGAYIGYQAGKDSRQQHEPNQTMTEYRMMNKCHVKFKAETVQDGYVVTYQYNGKIETTILPYRPGKVLEIEVHTSPK